MHTDMQARFLSLLITHALTHTAKKDYKPNKYLSTVPTCNLPKVHGTKQTKGEITLDQNGKKHAEVHCSTVASLLADYNTGRGEKKQKRERKGRKEKIEIAAPVLSSYSHLVSQE